MKHEELQELLPLYIDGGLDRDEVEMVEAHLAKCEGCQEDVTMYQKNFDFLSSVQDVELDESFLSSVMERIKEEKHYVPDSSIKNGIEKRSKWADWLKNLLKIRFRVPIGALGVGFAVILLIIIIRPFQDVQYDKTTPENSKLYSLQSELYDQSKSNRDFQETRMEKVGLVADRNEDLSGTSIPSVIERKIIHTADFRIEVKDIQAADETIISLTKELNGFISNSRKWESVDKRHFSSYTLRIPVNQFTHALTRIEALGKVKDRSSYGVDVTEEYIDIESRLKNLTLQEERYRELLNRATRVEDILQIERELERVRSTLESLQGRLNYLNDQIGLSTLNVELMEPEPITSTDIGIINALRQALGRMIDTFYDMIVRLGVILPYFILGVTVYILYRIFKKK